MEVLVPPDFTTDTSSADVLTPEGHGVTLVCRARGNPEPVVTWRREDGEGIMVKDSLGNRQLGKENNRRRCTAPQSALNCPFSAAQEVIECLLQCPHTAERR